MRRAILHTVVITLGLSVLMALGARADDTDDVWAAQRAALDWLALTDEGQYVESWEAAGIQLRTSVDEAAWEMNMRWTRAPLAGVLDRTLESSSVVHSGAGQKDSQSVVLRYRTVYEYKQAALETLTCTLGADGVWRVTAYLIQ
jgi:hypothetical protein